MRDFPAIRDFIRAPEKAQRAGLAEKTLPAPVFRQSAPPPRDGNSEFQGIIPPYTLFPVERICAAAQMRGAAFVFHDVKELHPESASPFRRRVAVHSGNIELFRQQMAYAR